MLTLAAGNSLRNKQLRPSGFTLLELLLVIAIVAVVSAGAAMALRDTAQAKLEEEAQRLGALLEQGRALSRASGVSVRWARTDTGFSFDGKAQSWRIEGIAPNGAQTIVLGPEPLIGPQSVQLWLVEQPHYKLQVATDGLRPFDVQTVLTVGATP